MPHARHARTDAFPEAWSLVLLDVGLAGRGAVGELASVGQRYLLEQPARLARLQRSDDHGDLVARLDHVEFPTDAIEDARIRAFDGVVLGCAVRVRRIEL